VVVGQKGTELGRQLLKLLAWELITDEQRTESEGGAFHREYFTDR